MISSMALAKTKCHSGVAPGTAGRSPVVIQAYGARLSTGPPAVAGPGIEPAHRPDQPSVGARSQLGTCRACNVSVTKGRFELPSPKGTTFWASRVYQLRHLVISGPCGN